jgi:Rps23 Pro-64 3,4-dihydroxylase Tpa1-like proline 4-hydroxylase
MREAVISKLDYDAIFASSKHKHTSIHIKESEFAKLPREQRERLLRTIDANAPHSFQYLHLSHRLSHAGEVPERLSPELKLITEFMTGERLIDFVRQVTGDVSITTVDVQATRYLPGHFIAQHNDVLEGSSRSAAYVLNLTRNWRADWGGVLMFPDEDGHIAEGFTPAFNTLNLFRVPQLHLVSQVASYAKEERVSLSGWLSGPRTAEP